MIQHKCVDPRISFHNHKAMKRKGNDVSADNNNPKAVTTIIEGLQGINTYLAMINGRLETLLLSDLPDYIKADLVKIYQAEEEASQIVRSLNIFCHKHF